MPDKKQSNDLIVFISNFIEKMTEINKQCEERRKEHEKLFNEIKKFRDDLSKKQ